jgi:hypothetical protein
MFNKMQDIKKICGVVDVKGFYINNVYYARECGIASNNIKVCQEFDPKICYGELNEKDKKYISKCTLTKHGLNYKPHYYSRLLDSENVGDFIKFCYELIKNCNSYKFAIQNENVKKILDQYGIPYVDLNKDINFPSKENLIYDYGNNCYYKKWVCSFHKYSKNVNCAYHKSDLIWKYIKDLQENFAEQDRELLIKQQNAA